MPKDPFLKAFDDLLEDQIESLDLENINPKLAVNEKRQQEIMKILTSLPETMETKAGTVKVHHLLLELNDIHHESCGIFFDIAIKYGFSLAYKLIFHNLTI